MFSIDEATDVLMVSTPDNEEYLSKDEMIGDFVTESVENFVHSGEMLS